MILISDNYFKFAQPDFEDIQLQKIVQFFKIALRLPYDTQIVLACRVFSLKSNLIKSSLLQSTFNQLLGVNDSNED